MAKFQFSWDKITTELQQEGEKKKGYQKDERFWKTSPDQAGNATAVIRFLPAPDGTPWIKYHTHNFDYMVDGVKKYWIRNCINDFGYDKECPICKKNQEYWNSAFQADKDIASKRKRKLIFVSNILVVKNPANPEDEGKVFLFSYGEKIFKKITNKMQPSPEVIALGEYEQYMPVDLYEGANLKIIQVQQGASATSKGFPNYDQSEFGKQGPVGTDKKIEEIMSKVYDLSEFIDEKKYPTNDEVIQKLGTILGLTASEPEKKKLLVEDSNLEEVSTNLIDLSDETIPDFTPPSSSEEGSSDDEDLDFFENLKNSK